MLTLVALSPPATAVESMQLSGTITNTDSVPQSGTVCIELVAGGSCSGNFFTDGTYSTPWTEDDEDPGDYLFRVRSSTMDGTGGGTPRATSRARQTGLSRRPCPSARTRPTSRSR